MTTLNLEPGIDAPIVLSDITSYCVGDVINIFSSEYMGEQVEYKWTFPTNSSIENAVTQTNQLVIEDAGLDNSGFYSVAVYVDGCLSYSSEDLYVLINEEPTVSLLSDYTICAYPGEKLELTPDVVGASGNPTFNWTGPLGFSSEEEAITLNNLDPSLSGIYTLTVTDNSACSAVFTSTTVQINPLPETPIISSNSLEVCQGENIELSIQNFSAFSSYIWTLNDGTEVQSNSATLTILDANPEIHNGIYSVLTLEGDCVSSNSNELTLEVVSLPDSLEISNTTSLTPACEGELVQLIGPKISDAVYTWLGPNDYTSNEQSPILNESRPKDSGIYSLYIEIAGCRSILAETEIVIVSTPLQATIEDIEVVCEQTDAILRVLNPDPELFYDWYRVTENVILGTGFTLSIPNVNTVNEGEYQVIARSEYCSGERSQPEFLRVEDPNNSIAFAGEDTIVCTPDHTLGTDTIDVRQGFWSMEDNLSNTEIIDSVSYYTRITDLAEGRNQFIRYAQYS